MPVPCGEYGKTETGGVRDMTRDQFLCEQMGLSQTYTPEGYDFIQVERDFGKYPADILALQQWVMDDDQHKDFTWEDFYWWAENRFADWYINEKNGELMQSERGHLFSKWLFSSPDRLADLVAEFRGWKPLRRY